jgi:hypothetical protein
MTLRTLLRVVHVAIARVAIAHVAMPPLLFRAAAATG